MHSALLDPIMSPVLHGSLKSIYQTLAMADDLFLPALTYGKELYQPGKSIHMTLSTVADLKMAKRRHTKALRRKRGEGNQRKQNPSTQLSRLQQPLPGDLHYEQLIRSRGAIKSLQSLEIRRKPLGDVLENGTLGNSIWKHAEVTNQKMDQ